MKTILKVLVVALVIASAVSVSHAAEKPNIVVIMTDNQGYETLAAMEE